MKVTILPTEQEFDSTCADRIFNQLKINGSVIGLSTGRTTPNMHRIVASRYNEAPFDISKTIIFAQDEIVGIPETHFRACRSMLRRDLINFIPLPEENFVSLPTVWDAYPQGCDEFDKKIGEIDLLVLGLGENGHLGFNQPGTPFSIGTNVTALLPTVAASVRRDAELPDDARVGGATLGLAGVMKAKKVLLVAKGDNKTDIVKQIIEGPVSEDFPATILQNHPDCEYLLDSKAAAKLTTK